ncbi:TonB-dependent receptor [Aliarcobacter vitoriensis]|uniref:TonB-dependent receptor n=1 Tax=Aliarcobacter vitoriensis TaxID=2011099 RepID=UPI003AAFB22A
MERKLILASLFVSSLLYANETTKLDEITVSANKMEENIKDVPQSISVITEEDIEQKSIKNISDVIKEVPNMNINNIGFSSFRGLNFSAFTSNNPVVIYLDGIPYSTNYDYNPSLANVEQIEVLRGPQGTIYGKDAIGGVVNIKTKTPTNQWKGNIQAEYGNDNTFNTKLNTSGAIMDNKLFAGINGSYYHTDGWMKNRYQGVKEDINEKNDRKVAGFLLWKPTENLSAKLTGADNHEKNYNDDSIAINKSKSLNSISRNDVKNINSEIPSIREMKVKAQSLNIAYDWEKVKFESTTTNKKSDYYNDQDGAIANDFVRYITSTDSKMITQEFKLSSKNQDIKWITGLYFDKEDLDITTGMESPAMVFKVPSEQTSKTYAAFGQTMIPLGDSFELTLGGRYQKIKKEIDSRAGMFMPILGQLLDHPYKDEKTWNAFLPKAALTYKINDNLSTYISFSKGYMPGGFNTGATFGGTTENMFEPQKSTNYEVGAKYIGNSFALNATIFRMEIEDIHVFKYVSPIEPVTSNAKKAHSQGIEIDGTYFITDNLSISGAVGLIQAKYDNYDNGNRKFDGEKIENTPKYTANLGISYLADTGIYGKVDLNAIGKNSFFDGEGNGSMLEADGAIITNAKVGYKVGDFDIYAFAKNLTNEDYVTTYLSSSSSDYWVRLNEPRRFGIGAIYKF